MSKATADLYDDYGDQLQVATPMFRDFGAKLSFSGPVSTLKVYEDNTLVRSALEEKGDGRVLVVDGGGSLRCALLGDMLAQLGVDNGWAGILVYGCIRDAAVIATMEIGVKALNSNPRKSVKKGFGERDIVVDFANVKFVPGAYLYADADGVLLANEKLV
ncbi:MAG: ribonuclease E activity regulator RraA [Gammaproteobacteria bacterium]|nr:ribonuclease E activity regulator RraA [Gammaproteobacteria bacterium]